MEDSGGGNIEQVRETWSNEYIHVVISIMVTTTSLCNLCFANGKHAISLVSSGNLVHICIVLH